MAANTNLNYFFVIANSTLKEYEINSKYVERQ